MKDAEAGGWSSAVTAGPALVVAGGPVKGGAGASVGLSLSNDQKGTEITLSAVKTAHGSTLTGDANVTHVFLDKGLEGPARALDNVQHDAFNGFDLTAWARVGIGTAGYSFQESR